MTLQVDEFLLSAYRPYRSLPELLQSLLDALPGQTKVAAACLRLQCERVFTCSHNPEATDNKQAAVWCTLPVVYAGQTLGELDLCWPSEVAAAAAFGFGQAFAQRCAFLTKRYAVQAWSVQRLGRPLLLVGVCEALHRLETFVENAAHSSLPVLLKGEFGTEKAQLAAALHCCGPQAHAPFVEVNCADPVGSPAMWFEQARGGTLFLNCIEDLARPSQGQLLQLMHSKLGQWLTAPAAGDIRIIASTTADLEQRVGEGLFSRQLLAELDFLTVALPPLRERPADIQAHMVSALERHGFEPHHTCTEALVSICQRHTWPENLFELERVVARLAVMNGGAPIYAADVMRHAPWLVGSAPPTPAAPSPVIHALPVPPVSARSSRLLSLRPAVDCVQCAVPRDLGELGRLHAALPKALQYHREHDAEPVSLDYLFDLAQVCRSGRNLVCAAEHTYQNGGRRSANSATSPPSVEPPPLRVTSSARAPEPAPLPPPTGLPSRYRLSGCLGRGGAGRVYAAWDEQLARPVAIKHTLHHADMDGLREAEITAGLRHPAFVAVFDAWRDATQVFIVMERVPGLTLKAHLSEHGAASPTQACGWMLQLAQALAVAHAQGLVHGDIKPSNLMLQPDESSTEANPGIGLRLRVLDLGIACRIDPLATLSQTHAASSAGTLGYMAPEQLRGHGPSVATDIYALGLVLLAALHGTTADSGSSRLSLAWRRLQGDPGHSLAQPHWPVPLNGLLAWLLAPDPAQRPANMTQVTRALGHLLAILHAPLPSQHPWPA